MDKRRDWFEWWLTVNPDRIYELFDTLPPQLVEKLNYSLESLLVFEEYLLEKYTYEDIIKENNRAMLDNLSRYVGEVARRNLKNAIWDVDVKNKSSITFNIPVIKAPNTLGETFCPLYAITRLLNQKKGNYIYKWVLGKIDNQKAAGMFQ